MFITRSFEIFAADGFQRGLAAWVVKEGSREWWDDGVSINSTLKLFCDSYNASEDCAMIEKFGRSHFEHIHEKEW